jgi:hypothetical protein
MRDEAFASRSDLFLVLNRPLAARLQDGAVTVEIVDEPEHRSYPELDSASVLLNAMMRLSTLPNAGSASAFILIYLEAGVLRYGAGSTLGLFDCRRSQSPLTRHSAQWLFAETAWRH